MAENKKVDREKILKSIVREVIEKGGFSPNVIIDIVKNGCPEYLCEDDWRDLLVEFGPLVTAEILAQGLKSSS